MASDERRVRGLSTGVPDGDALAGARPLALLYMQLAPADIALVKFLFESYEEVGIVRTVDRERAIIVVLVIEDFLPEARAILDDLHMRIDFTEIDPPPIPADDWLMREIADS